MNAKGPKPKKCVVCKTFFTQFTSLSKVCSVPCSLVFAKQVRATQFRKDKIEYRKANETKSELTKKAQAAFNSYIRLRDKGKPCISCGYSGQGNHLTGSEWDAGHYRSVGSCPELRFDEDNCNLQCTRCNRHLSGNTVLYRAGLLQKIGPERLAWIEGPHQPKHYTHEALRDLARVYRAKARELQKTIDNN